MDAGAIALPRAGLGRLRSCALAAPGPTVHLVLPSGYTSLETGASVSLSNIAPGASGTALFHLTAGSTISGDKSIYASAACSCAQSAPSSGRDRPVQR